MAKKKKGAKWVDFKEIKEKVTIKMLLDHYQVELTKSGKNYVGSCPIHKGTNPKQFSVNLERNIWRCFGNCNKGGNALDLVCEMEGGISAYGAAVKLSYWFALGALRSEEEKPAKEKKSKKDQELVRKKEEKPEIINPPLSFELKDLDQDHPFFKENGIDLDVVEHFGLGFCRKGMMKNRIAIPIHNEDGELIAYCGRAVNEEQEKEDGKYKLPSSEKGFYKSHVLYNLDRQNCPGELILVESFKSVWFFFSWGIFDVVSPLGSSVSVEQVELLSKTLGPNGKLSIVFDADESGRVGAENLLSLTSKKLYTKIVDISEYAKKPHQLKEEQIRKLFL